MNIKVYLRSPPDVLAPDLPAHVKAALPDLELPEDATVQTLLRFIGVGQAQPVVLVNKIQQNKDTPLQQGDRVDLVLPLGGG